MRLRRRIRIPGLRGWPKRLAVDQANNYLYVLDEGCCVYRVDLSNSIIASWNVTFNFYARGLSVNSRHNVLLAGHLIRVSGSPGHCSNGAVQEYSSYGTLIREVSDDYACIWQAVET